MRVLMLLVFAVSALAAAGCSGSKAYGHAFRAPYVASVPAGWIQSTCTDPDAIWLEEHDVMWVREDAPPCYRQNVRDVPSDALVFCSARRVAGAPSTYCDATRILHLRAGATLTDSTVSLCRGLRAKESTVKGLVASYPAIVQTVSARVGETTYFGLYLRLNGEADDARARASIRSICPLRFAERGSF